MAIGSTRLSDEQRRVRDARPKIDTQIYGIEPLVVKPRVAWRLLNCSNTRGYELLNAGELESFKDGKSRKIIVLSIHAYIARRLSASVRQKNSSADASTTSINGRNRAHRAAKRQRTSDGADEASS